MWSCDSLIVAQGSGTVLHTYIPKGPWKNIYAHKQMCSGKKMADGERKCWPFFAALSALWLTLNIRCYWSCTEQKCCASASHCNCSYEWKIFKSWNYLNCVRTKIVIFFRFSDAIYLAVLTSGNFSYHTSDRVSETPCIIDRSAIVALNC